MENIVFPSKVDWWLGLILLSLPVVAGSGLVTALLSGEEAAIFSALGGCAFIVALLFGIVWPLRYTLTAETIEIRFGLVRSRIPYSALKGISPTRSPLSNPALSLDRLRLERGLLLDTCISPADKEGFLRVVAARAPQLRFEGDRLVLKVPAEEN